MQLINQKRLKAHLEQLGQIGAEDGHGRTRISFTPVYYEARNLVEEWMKEAGLETGVDAIGNLFGIKKGKTDQVILVGSHIDTVPEAGIYDGCLGVLGAVEAMQTLNEQGIELEHTIKVAAWVDEEGTGILGLLGSRAYSGLPVDKNLKDKFEQYGIHIETIEASKTSDDVEYYLELHIEQGGILDHQKIDIGVVQAIVGIYRWTVHMKGQANHAGSTPMYLRNDAMVKTARFILQYDELVRQNEGMVGTIGKIRALPGTFNIIAGEVEFICEMRSVDLEAMDKVWERLMNEFGEELEYEKDFSQKATTMNSTVKTAITNAAEELKLSYMSMNSGAGHDTQSVAAITKPGMIFVPSVAGISHSPDEFTTWEDCANGANVLMKAVLNLDN